MPTDGPIGTAGPLRGEERLVSEAGLSQGTDASLGPVLSLMRLFWSLDHTIQIGSKSLERNIGLTEPQRAVMWLVAESGGITIGEVAERQHWHSATVTGIVQRLERRGLLSRRSDPADRRRKCLYTTAKGRRVVSTKAVTIDQIVAKALAEVPAEALAGAEQLIAAVVRELSTVGRGVPTPHTG